MHHDLSTAPLVDKKKEKNLFQRLVKYDFIFTPQKSSSKMFKNFMLRFSKKILFKDYLSFLSQDIPNLTI